MKREIVITMAVVLIVVLTVIYPLSDLIPQNCKAETTNLSTEESVLEAYGELPMLFIKNQGQLDEAVKYYIKTPAQTLYFTKDSIIFDLTRYDRAEADARDDRQTERLVFSLEIIGANSQTTIESVGKYNTVVNYFIGNDPEKWHTSIPAYKEVMYHDIYKSIDLRLYSRGEALAYDFIVRPGANPNDITLAYSHIDNLAVENDELVISTAFGNILQSPPYIYQQIADKKVEIEGGFSVASDNAYGFHIAAYNKSYPLIIDPTLTYSTYLGGSDVDEAWGVAVDAEGCAYVTGYTGSNDFPTHNPFDGIYAGDRDVFVTKLSPNGDALVYSTYLGGGSPDGGFGIAVDSVGCAYVTGDTLSSDFPTQNPYDGTHCGGHNIFVTKLSAGGDTLIYSTFLDQTNIGNGIAVDSAGCAYVTGWVWRGTYDSFVTKLSSAGDALVYSIYLGGSGHDMGDGITVDAEGCAYVTGKTGSTDFPTQNPIQGTYGGSDWDAFVAKLAPDGDALVYSTYLGGNEYDIGHDITVDAEGCAYVMGSTASDNFPTQNPLQGTHAVHYDAFVAKLTAEGDALVYSTYLGGNAPDSGGGIALDSAGCAYITGSTSSTDFPTQNPIYTYTGGDDAFVAKLTPTGDALVYSTYLGGSSLECGRSIAVDSVGCAYVTGYTESSDFPTQNPIHTHAGGADVFVARICLSSPTVSTNTATSIGAYSATLNMSYTCDYSTVAVRFAYKKSADPAWIYTTWVTNPGSPYALPVSGLDSNTQYDFRAELRYDSTEIEGAEESFTTTYPTAMILVANPKSITANGSSTSTVTATVKDDYGNNVPDGTIVTFTTSAGSIGSTTTTKSTTNGIATATLTSSTTDGVATVTATSGDAAAATAVFFTRPGVTVTDFIEEKTPPGQYTVDAKSVGDIEVIKSGDGTPTITVAKYSRNPAGPNPGGFSIAGDYIDVHLTSTDNVTQIEIRKYYTEGEIRGMREATLRMRWWSGSGWVECSNSGVNTNNFNGYSGYVWAIITNDTTPCLADLSGAMFAAMGTATVAPSAPTAPPTPSASRASPTPPRPLNPAQLSLQYLSISPQQTFAAQPVTITTNVVNNGDEAGSINIALKINGKVEQTRMVNVGPRGTQPVKFTIARAHPGTYTVDIGGQKASFTVLGSGSASGTSASGGLIVLMVMAVLILATAVVLVLSFRRPA